MTEFADHLDRLKVHAREGLARVRPHHLGVLAGIAVVCAAAMAVAAVARPGTPASTDGERLRIEVVAPVEPTVAPGSVMEVGHLIDGMESPPTPPPPVDPLRDVYYEAVPEAEKPSTGSKRYVEEAFIQAPPRPGEPRRDRRLDEGGPGFGFDGPERDYQAEREARRARMEARMDRERQARDVRRYRSDGRSGELRQREGGTLPGRDD